MVSDRAQNDTPHTGSSVRAHQHDVVTSFHGLAHDRVTWQAREDTFLHMGYPRVLH